MASRLPVLDMANARNLKMTSLPAKFAKILVIRRDNIGDLLCTTPLLTALRQRYPQAYIAVLANSYNAPILNGNPDISEVFHYTKAKHGSGSKLRAWWQEWQLYRQLRQHKFELLIHANPSPHRRTERLARFLRIPYRIGVVDTERPQRGFNIAIPQATMPTGHQVEKVMGLLTPLGITTAPGPMILKPPPLDDTLASQFAPLRQCQAIIGLHLSSRRPCNRWPSEAFAELMPQLLDREMGVALFWAPGSQHNPTHPGDDEKAAELLTKFPNQVIGVATHTLSELVSGLNQVDYMICADGGAMHIAAALGKPTVALFGCTDAKAWGPWQVAQRVLEGGGDAEHISVRAVLNALVELQHAI